jgi:hypothetical protein
MMAFDISWIAIEFVAKMADEDMIASMTARLMT